MEMRALGDVVSKKPVTTIIVVLLITALFGFYASQMQMSADLRSFLPNDAVVQAQMNVSKNFGDTDIMEIILAGNNTVSKTSLEDMFKVKINLEKDKNVLKYLKNPDSPENSIISPADMVVMGNQTINFEDKLIKILKDMKSNSSKINFSAMIIPITMMKSVIGDYHTIYENAHSIRGDAKSIVLLLFIPPSQGPTNMSVFEPIMENISATLINGENYSIKAMVLTMLTPPQSNETGGNISENPLLNFLVNDTSSNMSIDKKEVSVRNFIKAGNFTALSLNYTNSSLNSSIETNNELLKALNYVMLNLQNHNNFTAKIVMEKIISYASDEIENMEKVLPYYKNYNRSIGTFLYHLKNGNLRTHDILSVEQNISVMLSFTNGDFHNMLVIFNSTFNEWLKNQHIYYDVAYEANTTKSVAQGFIDGYNSAVNLKDTLTMIKNMIDHDSLQNTTNALDRVINKVKSTNQDLETQKNYVENATKSMRNPYYTWFESALENLDYVLQHSKTAVFAINIFNAEMKLMKDLPSGGGSQEIDIFYSLKHAFEAQVNDTYKGCIENMYLTEMTLASIMNNTPKLNVSFNTPNINMPDFSMNATKKAEILNNMSQQQIWNTINKVENYNPSNLTDTLNSTTPVLKNMSANMTMFQMNLSYLISGIEFVYNTTGESNVIHSLEMYKNISKKIENASMGLSMFLNNTQYLSGFSYMMDQFSTQLKNMFSKDFDGHHANAAIMIVMLNDTKSNGESSSEHSKKMERVEETVAQEVKKVKTHDKLMVMGSYMISEATEKTANETMNVLLPVAMILVVIILLVTFRSILDTVLGLVGLGLAILWAYGFGVIMNYDFNQISTMVAVLLVGLGIDYAIHTILRYREELRNGHKVREAMRVMITNLGMGLILATVTTVVAFLSNLSSPIPPIQSFGVMNAVGIFGAFIIFTTLVPAIKILIDERRERKGKLKIKKDEKRVGSGVVALNKFMALGAMGAEKHRYAVLILILLITSVAFYAGVNVNTTFDIKDFLPKNLEISHTIDFMMDNFNSSSMSDNYVLIQGNVTSPELIKAVDKTMNNIQDDKYVNYPQCKSITTYIEEWSEKNMSFAKMVSENDTDGDGLPDHNITAIYNWLYEYGGGNTILHKGTNGSYDSMLIVVSSTASTDKENRVITEEINDDIKPIKKLGYKATLTGDNILTFHVLDLLGSSEWNSLIITIVASLIVLTIVFYYEAKSYVLGLITSLPVIIALIWLLGSMYALGIGFNVVTVTITSLTIGLGITYAIHITHRYLEDLEKEDNLNDAVEKTVRQTGSSIFGAATTTMAGFGTLILSSMPPISEFGEIAALSILYSFVLSVFVLPSFLYMWAERRNKRLINEMNREKYKKAASVLIGLGLITYGAAFYLRWIGWSLVSYPPSVIVAIFGVLVIITGGEIYYRSERIS